ncbi:hypothetical protein OC846_003733 [Tilletia horrida]|uniref:Uncharacterized protein n=1 Tax=Tilletia horrida TaxID=155126 RepID=A0AAN6GPY1_9BASI|nr:hypothetical protein OC846_003733 [Tilletia horrida]KAK0565399.1 hypothetical protein OC861_003769 [Tilletia horrida]
MAAGTESGSFNSLWFLLLIPFILLALAIVITVWYLLSRRRNASRRLSTLRNVPTIQAEAEAQIEKMERKASLRSSSRKSFSITAHSSELSHHHNPNSSLTKADRATLERNLTRSLSTRSQRDVYVRTLNARQQQQHRSAGHPPNQPHPTTFRLSSSQSDNAHDRRSAPPSRSAPTKSQTRPWTPELEEGTAQFPSSSSSSAAAAQDDAIEPPDHPSSQPPYDTQSDDLHGGSSSPSSSSHLPKRNYHQYRRQDLNELSVIGEAEADISEGAISPSASHPSTSRAALAEQPRLPLSPSSVLAGAAGLVAAEPESYDQDISDASSKSSPFRDPAPTAGGYRQASTASTSGMTSSDSHQTSADGSVLGRFNQALIPSETSDSGEGQPISRSSGSGSVLAKGSGSGSGGVVSVAVPPVVTTSKPSGDDVQIGEALPAASAGHLEAPPPPLNASPGDPTPTTLTPRQGDTRLGEPSGSPSSDPNAKTPTMTSTPSPNALEREAEDAVPNIQPLGGARSAAAARENATMSSSAEKSGLGLASGAMALSGAAGKYLAPILPNILRPGDDNEAALTDSPTTTTTKAESGAATTVNAPPAGVSAPTATPTKPRASMSSLRSALAAPIAGAQPMVPSRSATGGSTGGGSGGAGASTSALVVGGGGGGGGGAAPAGAVAGGGAGGAIVPGGGAWTYTSRQSEWKTLSSTSVSRGAGADPRRASTTSLASRASSREGQPARPGLSRKTSHGVAGSIYREHFGDEDEGGRDREEGEEDDHSSRISHMLDEDEERERERERSARERERLGMGPSSSPGGLLERKASSASRRNVVAAALMRKSSSKSGRSSRAAGTSSRTSQA